MNETWLRTGEGEMFVQLSSSEELSAFFGDLLADEPDFRFRLISALSRLDPAEWETLEKIAYQLVDELKKADPE